MELKTTGVAGTMESSDIQIVLEPRTEGGIEISLTSNVMNQFGRQIVKVIRETLAELKVENAFVNAVDKGALDCTIKARVQTAAYRAAESDGYVWRTKT
mgnify:FL=1